MSSPVALDSNALNQVSRSLNNNVTNETDQDEIKGQSKEVALAVTQEKHLKESDNLEKSVDVNTAKNTETENESKAEVKEAIEIVSEFMQLSNKNVNFAQADGSDRTVIKVFDSESKELIKQFPSAEILAIAQKIVELRQDVGTKTGILLDEKV